jgi:type VI protein secretion system component VasK
VGLLIGVAVVFALMWLAWRFSPRRRMTRKWSMGEVSQGERTDQNIDRAIIEERAKDLRDGMGGL